RNIVQLGGVHGPELDLPLSGRSLAARDQPGARSGEMPVHRHLLADATRQELTDAELPPLARADGHRAAVADRCRRPLLGHEEEVQAQAPPSPRGEEVPEEAALS